MNHSGPCKDPAEESEMKSTTTAVAVLLASTAFAAIPAAAQSNYGAQSAPQQPIPEASQQSDQAKPAAQAAQQSATAIKTHVPKLSGASGKAIVAYQKAVTDNDAAGIPAALAAAQAVAKSADDRYALALIQLKAAADSKNQAGISSAIEAMLASGGAAEDEKFSLYYNLAESYDAQNQGARAMQAYQEALKLNANSVEATAGLAEAMVSQGQAAQGIALLQKGISLQSAGGAKAPEAWYKRAVAIAYKAKLPQAMQASRDWLQAYPTSSGWHDALAIYQNLASPDEGQTLDLMRLKRAAGVLSAGDYFTYGDIAVRKGYAGEAKAILDQGFAKNEIKKSDPSFSQLYTLASQKSQGDKASLPAAPEASANARQTLNFGDAWYGYGDYDKAVAFDQAALGKAEADPNLINLHLGMALAMKGDKAGAAAALGKVGGAQAELAKYWLLYANTKA